MCWVINRLDTTMLKEHSDLTVQAFIGDGIPQVALHALCQPAPE